MKDMAEIRRPGMRTLARAVAAAVIAAYAIVAAAFVRSQRSQRVRSSPPNARAGYIASDATIIHVSSTNGTPPPFKSWWPAAQVRVPARMGPGSFSRFQLHRIPIHTCVCTQQLCWH
jgi:hypothetical protein